MGRTENPSHHIGENVTCKWCSKQKHQSFFVIVTVVKIHLSLNLNTYVSVNLYKQPKGVYQMIIVWHKSRRKDRTEVKPPRILRGYWRLVGSLQSSARLTESAFSRNGDHFAPDTGLDKRYLASENSVRILPCKRTGSNSQS